jgi:hypothetical protein
LGEEGRHKGINGGDFRIQHGPAGAFKQKGTVLLCMSIILVFLAGFLAGLELKRVPEQENPCFRSLFPGRATYCLTKRYTEPYVSAHMRPLVQSTGRNPFQCPHCGEAMAVWRIWHPKYGVIYDEGEVMKRGTYASTAQRAGP